MPLNNATPPSNRSFGTLVAVVFGLFGAWGWWHLGVFRAWTFSLSGLTLAVTVARPDWLGPANRAWMRLAALLHRGVTPIVLGGIFFGIFTPIGWGMRRAGRDALKRGFEPAASTYWVERDPPGTDPARLKNQF
jgi:hypothetical protein